MFNLQYAHLITEKKIEMSKLKIIHYLKHGCSRNKNGRRLRCDVNGVMTHNLK